MLKTFLTFLQPQNYSLNCINKPKSNGLTFADYMQKIGYDGVKMSEGVWGVFEPNQIKLTTNEHPTADPDIRYSREEPQQATPEDYSEGYRAFNGTPITNGVANWAKDSKFRFGYPLDEGSELELYYHGSPWLFDHFEDRYWHNGRTLGDGYYLTRNKQWAKQNYAYGKGDQLYEFILNGKKPFTEWGWIHEKNQIQKRIPELIKKFDKEGLKSTKWSREDYYEEFIIDNFERNWRDESPSAEHFIDSITKMARRNDIDTRDIWRWLGYDSIKIGDEVVIFDSNQAKRPDNPAPTEDSRFAYSRTEEQREARDAMLEHVNMKPNGKEKPADTIDNMFIRAGRAIVRAMFNKDEALVKFDNYVAKQLGKKIDDVISVHRMFDNFRRAGNGESTMYQVAHGITDLKTGKKISMGLSDIIEELTPTEAQAKVMGMSIDEARAERVDDFIALGVAERAIEYDERGKESGIDLEQAQEVVDAFENDTQLHKALKDFRDIGNSLIDYAQRMGLISKETADMIKKNNLMYFPMSRVLDNGTTTYGSASENGAVPNPFKKVKGSTRQIENPLISAAGNWARIIQTIETNYMYQQMSAVVKQLGEDNPFFEYVKPKRKFVGEISAGVFKARMIEQLEDLGYGELADSLNFDEMQKLFVPVSSDPKNMVVSFMEDGKRKYIKFKDNDYGRPMYEVLSRLGTKKGMEYLNLVNWFNKSIMYGATILNTEFAVGNAISDSFMSYLTSENLRLPLISIAFDAARLAKARASSHLPDSLKTTSVKEIEELYDKFKRSGYSNSGKLKSEFGELYNNEIENLLGFKEQQVFGKERIRDQEGAKNKLKALGKKINNKRARIARALEFFPEFSEEMARFGIFADAYKRFIKQGYSEADALYSAGMKSREGTQDFSIRGNVMEQINKLIPYSAATVGGLYRFGREFRTHPARLAIRMAPLMALAFIIKGMADDEDRKYLEEMNSKKKFDNFVIGNGTSEPYTIKKPQGVPRYFINLMEFIYDAANGYIPEDKINEKFGEWLKMSLEDQVPLLNETDVVPGFIQPFLENRLNKDFYYNSQLVPNNLLKLDARNQYDEYTSELAKAIGNIFNWSPIKIDNIIKSNFAGLGKQFLDLTDELVKEAGGNPLPDKKKSERYILSRLFANSLRNPTSINEIYDRLEYLENQKAEGRITPDEQREYDQLSKAKTTLYEYNKKIKATRNDSSLSSKEKADKISKLQLERADTARYYLGKPLINSENSSNIDLIEYYPAQDTYTYKVGNRKVELSFASEEVKVEYAEMFKKDWEKELEKLKRSTEYKNANENERYELEKSKKSKVRESTTNKMKEIVYKRERNK